MGQSARQVGTVSVGHDLGELHDEIDAIMRGVGAPLVVGGTAADSPVGRDVHEKAAAYDALLDALGDDMDRRLAEINATLDRLAA